MYALSDPFAEWRAKPKAVQASPEAPPKNGLLALFCRCEKIKEWVDSQVEAGTPESVVCSFFFPKGTVDALAFRSSAF
jgi:hypothetical protein